MNSGVLPMNYDNAVDLIDHLIDQQSDKYFADFVPFTFQNEDYAELEMYLNVHFKPWFAEKIKFIAFALMHQHESHVYLDEAVANALYPDLKNKNLRNIGLERLGEIIDTMVIDNYGSLNILLKQENDFSLMRIEDGFSTIFFNLKGQLQEEVESLVEHQGLYFKEIDWADQFFSPAYPHKKIKQKSRPTE